MTQKRTGPHSTYNHHSYQLAQAIQEVRTRAKGDPPIQYILGQLDQYGLELDRKARRIIDLEEKLEKLTKPLIVEGTLTSKESDRGDWIHSIEGPSNSPLPVEELFAHLNGGEKIRVTVEVVQ